MRGERRSILVESLPFARMLIILTLILALFSVVMLVNCGTIANSNQAPVASFTYSPANPGPEETTIFNASASYDPDGWIVEYTWNFGDGKTTTVTDPITTYSYPLDGNYTVELTVTDNSGSTGVATAVIQVSTVVFFRVCALGTLIPLENVEVTAYYNNGHGWVTAPVGPHGFEIKYDNITQPDLANTPEEKYRNPGYTASILSHDASNIGFDLHPAQWTVFFKFKWGSYVTYWPNSTTRVYSYKDGLVETHDYLPGHRAYWDSAASTYVIKVKDIPGHGVSPSECHPIIVGISCIPPTQQYYLTVRTAPPGITTILGGGGYAKNTNVTLTAPSYVNVSTNTRYRFYYWDVDGNSQGVGVNPITVRVNANHTATAHYILQYLVVFNQTGFSSDATGTVVTANGNTKTFTDLPYTPWVDNGSSVSYSYSSTVSSSISGKSFRLNSVSGPLSPVIVTSAVTVTGNYIAQYRVTFAQTGLDATANGKVVTVNGNTKVFGDLPYSFWSDTGSSVTYSYNSTVSSNTTGKQFWLSGVSGPSSPITVTGPTTVTDNYVTQYLVTFTHSGLDPTAIGTVVTVNGNAKTFADLPFSVWANSGSSVTYFYSNVSSSTVDKRFILTGTTGLSSPITVTNPTTVTGNYKTQYKIIFDQSGVGADFTGTVVTVDSINYGVVNLPVQFWWDQGSNHNFAFASPLVVNASKQYLWSSTSGLSNLRNGTLTVTTSGSVVGNYVVQNCITFDQLGASSDFTGTVVIIDGTSYRVTDLPLSFKWTIGSVHNFSFQSPLVVAAYTKQYVWISTTGLSSSQSGSITVATFGSIIGNYKTQYYLTVTSSYGTRGGQGWYDSGATPYATLNTGIIDQGNGTRRVFTNWNGDASGTNYAQSNQILMDGPKTAVANWKTQYTVTFTHSGLDSSASSIVLTANGTSITFGQLPYTTWADRGSPFTYSYSNVSSSTVDKRFILTGTTGLSSPITVTNPTTVTGNYKTQYQITFSQTGVGNDFTGTIVTIDGTGYNYGTLPSYVWWDVDSVHTFTYQSPLLVTPNAKQYAWTSTTGLSTLRSDSITVSGSGSVTGNYRIQYYLAVVSPYATRGGAGWYDSGSTAYATVSISIVDHGNGTRRIFTNWSGDATGTGITSDPITMNAPKTATANWKTQYYLTVATDPTGLSPAPTPSSNWYDNCTYVVVTAPNQSYLGAVEYDFVYWDVDGANDTNNPITVHMDQPYTATAHYQSKAYGPTAKFTETPIVPRVNETVTFDASTSEPGFNGTHYMPIVNYTWDFGDGNITTVNMPIITHVYSNSGAYNVSLTVYAPGATPDNDTAVEQKIIRQPIVGGHFVFINKLQLLAPQISIALALLAATIMTTIGIKRRRKKY